MMNYFNCFIFSFCAFLIVIPAESAEAQYIPEQKIIVAHQTVEVLAPDAQTLTIVYRPGSNISDTVRVALSDGAYNWTPREAGIVALQTPNGPKQTVSVRFDEAPFWGYFIMFGAAFILFGGAVFASLKLFGKATPDDVASRPDT